MTASFLSRLHCNAPVDRTVPSAEDGAVTMDLDGRTWRAGFPGFSVALVGLVLSACSLGPPIHGILGNAKWNVAPWSGFGVAQSRPPCASMIDRLIDRPMPMPLGFVV